MAICKNCSETLNRYNTSNNKEQKRCDKCLFTSTPYQRLEYLRQEIIHERISTAEIAELQGLTEHIDKGDVLLLEWAGVPEHETEGKCPECSGKTANGYSTDINNQCNYCK